MAKADIYTLTGKRSGKFALPEFFDVKVKPALIQQAYLYELSQTKFPTAHSKNRGQVAGSGKKPWRQKGTGRARAGSVRSPLWRGGGITFGPNSQINFAKRIPKKQRLAAIYSVLAGKFRDNEVFIIPPISLAKISTKELAGILANLPTQAKTVLMITKKPDAIIYKSARNIPYVKIITWSNINVMDLLNFDLVVIAKDAFTVFTKKLTKHNKKK